MNKLKERVYIEIAQQNGSAILAVLFVSTVALIVLFTTLSIVTQSLRSVKNQSNRSYDFYKVETSLNQAFNWLQKNADELIELYASEHFSQELEFGEPSIGSNDDSIFSVVSNLKIKDTNKTPLLVNDLILGTPAYPNIRKTLTKSSLVEEFLNNKFGGNLVRITLVNAVQENDSVIIKSKKKENSSSASSNFMPIYRIDAMSSLYNGAHLYSYVTSTKSSSKALGFFGVESLLIARNCDAYTSSDGSYGKKNISASCNIGSNITLGIYRKNTIYGSAHVNKTLLKTKRWSGTVCATLDKKCKQPGKICEGAGCSPTSLPPLEKWNEYCPSDQGNLNVKENLVLSISEDLPKKKCWNQVRVGKNTTLTLTGGKVPFFIKKLQIGKRGRLVISPATNQKLTLFTEEIVNSKFTGQQIINTDMNPTSFQFNYTGKSSLTLNGSSHMHMFLFAPNASISLNGTFDFFGSIHANKLVINGKGMQHQDLSLEGEDTNSNLEFVLLGITEYLR